MRRCRYCVGADETLLSGVRGLVPGGGPDGNWLRLWAVNGNDDGDPLTVPLTDPGVLLAGGAARRPHRPHPPQPAPLAHARPPAEMECRGVNLRLRVFARTPQRARACACVRFDGAVCALISSNVRPTDGCIGGRYIGAVRGRSSTAGRGSLSACGACHTVHRLHSALLPLLRLVRSAPISPPPPSRNSCGRGGLRRAAPQHRARVPRAARRYPRRRRGALPHHGPRAVGPQPRRRRRRRRPGRRRGADARPGAVPRPLPRVNCRHHVFHRLFERTEGRVSGCFVGGRRPRGLDLK